MNRTAIRTLGRSLAALALAGACRITCAADAPATSTAPAGTQPAGPRYGCDEPVFTLKGVWSGDKVLHSFVIRNDGSEPLAIKNVEAACGCFVAEDYPRSIEPGRTGELRVSLQTARGSKEVHKEMQVETNDPQHPASKLTIAGPLTPRIEVEPMYGANWGRFYPGTPLVKTVKLTNHFTRAMKLEMPTEGLPKDFSFVLKVTEPGRKAELVATAADKLSEGSHMFMLKLKTGLPEEPELVVPCTLFVPPLLESTLIGFSPFRTTADTDVQTLMLRWNGPKPMHIRGIESSDAGLITELKEKEAGRVYNLIVTMPKNYTPGAGEVEIRVKTDLDTMPLIKIPLHPRTLKTASGPQE